MRKLLLSILAVVGVIFAGLAQNKMIRGTVTDPAGNPVVGAAVVVTGTGTGVTTNPDGRFAVQAPANGTLDISFLGFVTQRVAINNQTNISVSLKEDTHALEEVIVVAYGTSTKESFTGSASVIKGEDLEKRPVSNVTKAIEGLAPGIQATSGEGQPGSGSSISIRGFGSINASTNPLYVVDGVAYNGAINAINPDDIESITVLKDASAGALYGARGANGVIIITTKQGRKSGVDVNFKATLGVSSRAVPTYDLVNQREFVELSWRALYNDAYFTSGLSDSAARQYASSRLGSTLAGAAGEVYNPFKNYTWDQLVDPATGKVRADAVSVYNENWLDEMTDNSAFRQEYQVSVSGGNDINRGSMSFSFLDEDGILKSTNFQRYTGRVAYDTTPVHWFRGNMSMNFAHTESNTSRFTGSTTSNPFYTAQFMAPIYPLYVKDAAGNDVLDANGKRQYDYGATRPNAGNTNIVAGFYDDPTESVAENMSARGSVSFGSDDKRAGWAQGLKGTVNLGVDYRSTDNMQYYNPFYGNQASNGGLIYRYHYRDMTYTFNQLITYNRRFDDKHDVSALLGHEFYSFNEIYLEASRSGLVPGMYEVVGSGINSAESQSVDHRIESYFARLNYGYDNKYYVDASWRTDGSSRFAPKTRWGNFWSVGASWRLSQEKFMENADWVDNITVKASYGVQGNEAILNSSGNDDYYGYHGYYNVTVSDSGYGFSIATLENPTLSWEKNANFNAGVEFSLFGQRLSGTVEYYNRKTYDMILDRPMAFSTGFDSYRDNIGSMRNTGWEITLQGVVLQKKDLRWDFTVMGSTVNNKVLELTPETPEILSGGRITRAGLPINSYYLARYAGVDPATGLALYYAKDAETGEEYVTSNTSSAQANRQVMGSRIPSLYGSIGTNFSWKGLDLSVLTTYSIGGKVYDSLYANSMEVMYLGNTFHRHALRAWTKPGDITDVPRTEIKSGGIMSDRFLVDASYFSIKNITLGYSLPQSAVKKIGLKNLRVFASVDNLALFTHMQGMNPTASLYGSNTYVYTPARTFAAGLDIKF